MAMELGSLVSGGLVTLEAALLSGVFAPAITPTPTP
jgi:hypothetical protein